MLVIHSTPEAEAELFGIWGQPGLHHTILSLKSKHSAFLWHLKGHSSLLLGLRKLKSSDEVSEVKFPLISTHLSHPSFPCEL